MLKRQYYTKKEELDRRSQNIIDEIGGVDNLLQFYYQNQSFLGIAKVGFSTHNQLCSYCEYLASVDKINLETAIVDYIEVDIEKSARIYEIEKAMLSVRVKNVLDKLEASFKYNEREENRQKYFEKIFSKYFDFYSIQNIGTKSVNELLLLRKKILSGYDCEDTILVKGLKSEVNFSKINSVEGLLGQHDKDEFIVNDKYNFAKILCAFLFTNIIIKEKYQRIMQNRYFSNSYLDRKQLSHIIHITPERIRQVENNLKETLLPLAINFVKQKLSIEFDEIVKFELKNFVELKDFEHFYFKGKAVTPNSDLTKFIYQNIFSSYFLIDEFIKVESRSFVIPRTNYFISKAFIGRTNFINLLTWADEQIYSFAIISFDYSLEILIQRYYSEHDYAIEKEDLKDLYSIFKVIKKEEIGIKQNIKTKFDNKAEKEIIINEVYMFLKEKNIGQTSKAILNHLNSKSFLIKKNDLLRLLHNNSSTFSFLGMGNWNLQEWNTVVGQSRGSFMHLIRNLLLKNDEPLHISELHLFINTIKKVSVHSLYSNLKLETKGTFKFFNCGYIGLNEKHYSDYWSKIPKYKPTLLNKYSISENRDENLKRVNYLATTYGYPEKHLLFILDAK